MRLAVALALLAALAVAGCIGKNKGAEDDEVQGQQPLDNDTIIKVGELASPKPSRYQFTDTAPAERRVVTWFNGTIGSEANTGVENPQDRGGTSFGTILRTEDFTALVPEGQPTLINARLWWDNKPGNSVDLDVYVDAYAARTHEAHEYADEMTWTLPVKTLSVTTVGAGQPTLIGVQAANGRITSGSVDYWMRIEFIYGADVAAVKVPYALQVGKNTSGLIVESVKFAGDTHVKGRFLVVGPDDALVAAVTFDDIAIPTQSVFIPTNGPGEYVFYVVDVKNGFFTVRSDAPLDDPVARPLALKATETLLVSDPAVPGGVAQHWVDSPVNDYQEGAAVPFNVDGTFPLELAPFIAGEGFTGDVELRVTNAKGLVAKYHRFLRHDSAQGTVGVSDEDIPENNAFHPENLALGAHTLSVVVNGMQGQAGVRVVTYVR